MGLGCRKLLLSENNDCDSAAAPSKGDRTVNPATQLGTTRDGLLRPGGGDGESLPEICDVSPLLKLMESEGLLVGLTGSQFGVKEGRPVKEPRPRSESGPSGVMFSESEPPSKDGVLWCSGSPLGTFPVVCNEGHASLLLLLELCDVPDLPFVFSPVPVELCRKLGFVL